MATVVEEVGTLAAENVADILGRIGEGAAAGVSTHAWSALVDAGWASITADTENGVELREIQEIARATGRFSISTPLATTLLAGRWFELDDAALDAGVIPLIARGSDVVVPYYAPEFAVVDEAGTILHPDVVTVTNFSLLVPVGVVVGDELSAIRSDQLAETRAVFAAVAVGCADKVIERSIDWAQTRQQFGQPLKGFQAVRHHLANMHIAREQAWTAAIAAAHEYNRSAAWSAQAFALARRAIELGIQVHGGVGFTAEVGLHHFLNHVLELESTLGDHHDAI